MTTHSASIVENLPAKAIVCLRRFNDQIIAEGNLNFQYAFTEIEEGITKKHVIVEDLMAKHIIEGIIRLIDKPPLETDVPFKVYNIGNNNPVKISDFITILEKAIGKEAKKIYLPMQKGDVYETYADITDLKEKTGFAPKTSLAEGLKQFVKWYKEFYNA